MAAPIQAMPITGISEMNVQTSAFTRHKVMAKTPTRILVTAMRVEAVAEFSHAGRAGPGAAP